MTRRNFIAAIFTGIATLAVRPLGFARGGIIKNPSPLSIPEGTKIYRLDRAKGRFKHVIDVGSMDTKEIRKYLDDFRGRYKTTPLTP